MPDNERCKHGKEVCDLPRDAPSSTPPEWHTERYCHDTDCGYVAEKPAKSPAPLHLVAVGYAAKTYTPCRDKPYTLTINGREVRTWLEWKQRAWDTGSLVLVWPHPGEAILSIDGPEHLSFRVFFYGGIALTGDELAHLADDLRAIREAMELGK